MRLWELFSDLDKKVVQAPVKPAPVLESRLIVPSKAPRKR